MSTDVKANTAKKKPSILLTHVLTLSMMEIRYSLEKKMMTASGGNRSRVLLILTVLDAPFELISPGHGA